MTASKSFADYPIPVESTLTELNEGLESPPPTLRGITHVIVGEIVSRFPSIQRYFWNAAQFGTVTEMPVLDDVPCTFQPCVTPLGKTGPIIEFGPELLHAKYRKVPGRYYTASDYHELFKSGQLTPLQVTEALLSVTSKAPSNNPCIYQDAWADSHGKDHLALEAAKASTKRYAAGEPLSVLDGVPIGVKDDVEVEGYVNHYGLRYDASLPIFKEQETTCWPVKKLQEAGAVVLGKNCMHELAADLNGVNITQGTPTNHLNTSYYPGGSSSGAGSALGAGVVPICVGTDTGGSIRIPATFNGVYALKPSHHRTFATNSTLCVVGPMASSVADLTIAYRVMSQPNPECPVQGRFALSIPPSPSAPRVIGVFRDWWAISEPRVSERCNAALDHFVSKCGYEVVDISLPCLSEARIAHSGLCLSEWFDARRWLYKSGKGLSFMGPANKILLKVGSSGSASQFLKYCAIRTVLMRHLAFLFQKHPGLLIMTPSTPLAGWPSHPGDVAHGMTDLPRSILHLKYVFLANMTGIPAVAAPVGYVEPEHGDGDIPIALMAMGEWGSEEQLLAWAGEAESYLHETYDGGRRRPKTWLDVMTFAGEKS